MQFKADREIERIILYHMFTHSEALMDGIEQFIADDFLVEQNKKIFRVMVELEQEGVAVDLVNVTARLFQIVNAVYITEIFDLRDYVYTEYKQHFKLFKMRNTKIKLFRISQGIQKQVADPEADLDAVMSSVEDELLKMSGVAQGKNFESLCDLSLQYYDTIMERVKSPDKRPAGLPTDFPAFDRVVSLTPGDLVILAGRPSMGKTAFYLNLMTNLAKNNIESAAFSIEMSNNQLQNRIAASLCEVDSKAIEKGVMNERELQRFQNAMSEMHMLPIHLNDSASLTFFDLRRKVRRLKIKHPALKIVFIDYLQILQYDMSQEYASLCEITSGLKNLARDLDVVVVLLSQLNRECESRKDKRPLMSDLRGSGSIEQDADVVIFLYRDEYYYPKTKDPGIAECIVAKNRMGATGFHKYEFKGKFSKFIDLESRYNY